MLTADHARKLLQYDPDTGLFRWRNPTVRQPKGWFAGYSGVRGYLRIWIKGRHYLAHRVAILIVTGEWPGEVDHDNHNQSDNVWTNLKDGTHTDNMRNVPLLKTNTTGYKGVSRFGNRFRATLKVNGQQISLGVFDTASQAAKARAGAEKRHYNG